MSAAEDIAEQGPSMSLIDPVSGETTELRLDDSEAVMSIVQGYYSLFDSSVDLLD